MERKLIAIDLDGTTLNNQSVITPETYQVLQKLIKQGHIISIATGRSYRTSSQYYKQLRLETPMVNFNGAWCHHPNDISWDYGYHRSLNREIALSMLDLKQYSVIQLIAAEAKDLVYVDRNYEAIPEFIVPLNLEDVNTLPFTPDVLAEEPTSVNVFSHSQEHLPFIQEKIIEKYGKDVEVRTWGGDTPTLEVVSAGIQKAVGVERVAQYYDIDRNNIIAFGDEANDYEMIQYAGHGVVMINGIDDLKNIADDVTPYSNDEDGLAHYLIQYFNLVSGE